VPRRVERVAAIACLSIIVAAQYVTIVQFSFFFSFFFFFFFLFFLFYITQKLLGKNIKIIKIECKSFFLKVDIYDTPAFIIIA